MRYFARFAHQQLGTRWHGPIVKSDPQAHLVFVVVRILFIQIRMDVGCRARSFRRIRKQRDDFVPYFGDDAAVMLTTAGFEGRQAIGDNFPGARVTHSFVQSGTADYVGRHYDFCVDIALRIVAGYSPIEVGGLPFSLADDMTAMGPVEISWSPIDNQRFKNRHPISVEVCGRVCTLSWKVLVLGPSYTEDL